MTNIVRQNKSLVKQLKGELKRLKVNILVEVNSLGVIQILDELTGDGDVISTTVGGEWYRLMAWDGHQNARKALDLAQAKFGYGGTHTMNPGAGKLCQ